MTTLDLAEIEATLVRSLLTIEQGGAALLAYGGQPVALIMPLTSDPLTEHATRRKSGDYVVHCGDPDVDAVYPVADWISHQQVAGVRVLRRRVIVVDQWSEVSCVPDELAHAYRQELAKAQAAWLAAELAVQDPGAPPIVTAVAAVLGLDAHRLDQHVEGIHGWEPHDAGYEAAVWAAAKCTDHDAELAGKQP